MSTVARGCPQALQKSQLRHGRFRKIAADLAKQMAVVEGGSAGEIQISGAISSATPLIAIPSASPLIAAVYKGDFAEVTRLVNEGQQHVVDSIGFTPLMAAAPMGKIKT